MKCIYGIPCLTILVPVLAVTMDSEVLLKIQADIVF